MGRTLTREQHQEAEILQAGELEEGGLSKSVSGGVSISWSIIETIDERIDSSKRVYYYSHEEPQAG